jgi:hypothetical protein
MNTNDTNIAAWMIAGGLGAADPADERNLAHLRALRASRSRSGIVSRLAAAVAALRPAAAPANPDCCPA